MSVLCPELAALRAAAAWSAAGRPVLALGRTPLKCPYAPSEHAGRLYHAVGQGDDAGSACCTHVCPAPVLRADHLPRPSEQRITLTARARARG